MKVVFECGALKIEDSDPGAAAGGFVRRGTIQREFGKPDVAEFWIDPAAISYGDEVLGKACVIKFADRVVFRGDGLSLRYEEVAEGARAGVYLRIRAYGYLHRLARSLVQAEIPAEGTVEDAVTKLLQVTGSSLQLGDSKDLKGKLGERYTLGWGQSNLEDLQLLATITGNEFWVDGSDETFSTLMMKGASGFVGEPTVKLHASSPAAAQDSLKCESIAVDVSTLGLASKWTTAGLRKPTESDRSQIRGESEPDAESPSLSLPVGADARMPRHVTTSFVSDPSLAKQRMRALALAAARSAVNVAVRLPRGHVPEDFDLGSTVALSCFHDQLSGTYVVRGIEMELLATNNDVQTTLQLTSHLKV